MKLSKVQSLLNYFPLFDLLDDPSPSTMKFISIIVILVQNAR
jgi:hypothetical protein